MVDAGIPSISDFSIQPLSNNLSISIYNISASDNTGVTGYCVSETDSSSGCLWNNWNPGSFTFPSAGNKTLYAFVRDAAGNISPSVSATTIIDQTKPTISAFSLPEEAFSLTVPFASLTVNDNVEVTAYYLSEWNAAPTLDYPWVPTTTNSYEFYDGDGKTLYLWVRDGAGNISNVAVATTYIETEAPTVTAFTLPVYSHRNLAVSSFTASDNGTVAGYCLSERDDSSTCRWSTTPPASYFFNSGGQKVLYAFAKDAVGNISPSVSATVTASNAVFYPAAPAKTGQTTSYAAGDDGDLQNGIAAPTPRFVDVGDGTIEDHLTGLIWAKDASTPTAGNCNGGPQIWQGALDYVACLNDTQYLGYSDWLLPNINELKSLMDLQNIAPSLPIGHPFTGVQSDEYWSSSTVGGGDHAWIVNLFSYVSNGYKFTNYYVWPVRRGQCSSTSLLRQTGQAASYASDDDGALQRGVVAPSPHFSDNGDGTVTDNLTRLVWLKNANCFDPQSWISALSSSNTLASGSCFLNDGSLPGDWRLPNREELTSLVDRGHTYRALPTGNFFVNVPAGFFWSSSTSARDSDIAWVVGMDVGYVSDSEKAGYNYFWPVRGGQSTLTLALTGNGNVTTDYGVPFALTGGSGQESYETGAVVTLQANPAIGSYFTGWGGACSGTGSCVVTLSTAQAVTANFAQIAATGMTLTPDLATPQTTTTSITFNAAATGGDAGPYEYRFWWRSAVAGSKWSVGQPYSPNTTWSWNTATLGLPAGSYYIQVDTRHIGNLAKSEATKSLTYKLVDPVPPTGVTLTTNIATPQPVGSTVTFTAKAIGGDIRPYEYRFWWRSAVAGSTWTVGQAYSTSTTWIWNTASLGLAAGSYYIQVDTRHVGNTAKSEMIKSLTYKLVVPIIPATGVMLTTNVSTPQPAGTTVTFTGQATGGDVGPYEYRFWWRPTATGATWTVGQGYSTDVTWDWNTATLGLPDGNYFIQVDTRHIGSTVKSENKNSMSYILN